MVLKGTRKGAFLSATHKESRMRMALRRLTATTAAVTAAGFALSSCTFLGTEREDSPYGTSLVFMGAAATRVINDDLTELSSQQVPPQNLEFVNAGSPTLVQQLADGAPADIFISSDTTNMNRALDNGSVRDPRVVASNEMVLVTPQGNPGGVSGVDDLADAAFIMCDPQVPCGTISSAILEDLEISVDPVSLEHSVSDTLGKVISGDVDAGFVYVTDALAAGEDVEVLEIPNSEEHPNDIVAAPTTYSENPEQADLLASLLAGNQAAEIWDRHGFGPPQDDTDTLQGGDDHE